MGVHVEYDPPFFREDIKNEAERRISPRLAGSGSWAQCGSAPRGEAAANMEAGRLFPKITSRRGCSRYLGRREALPALQ